MKGGERERREKDIKYKILPSLHLFVSFDKIILKKYTFIYLFIYLFFTALI